MFQKLCAIALLGVCCSLTAYADDEKKPVEDGKPGAKFDKAKLFDKMDGNSDGKVTKDEFKTAMERLMERFKDKLPGGGGKASEFMEKRFTSIDTNSDGSLSKEEFEKAQPPAGLKGKFKGKARKQDD